MIISGKSFLSGYLHRDRNLHSKFQVSSSSTFGSAMIVSPSVSPFIYRDGHVLYLRSEIVTILRQMNIMWMINDDHMIQADERGQNFLTFVFQLRINPRKNPNQETVPTRNRTQACWTRDDVTLQP